MESENWVVAGAISKRHSSAALTARKHSSTLAEDDEDIGAKLFPCPYCYEDFDIATLGSHVEGKHPFESRMAICPVCSAKVWRDMAGHITLNDRHLCKIHSQNRFAMSSASTNATLSLLGKELNELHLHALIGDVSSTCTISSSIVESLLLSFGYKVASSETGDTETEDCPDESNNDQCVNFHQPNPRLEGLSTTEEREKRSKQGARRSDFVQQIVLSTLMDER